jgi:hypothetical protein
MVPIYNYNFLKILPGGSFPSSFWGYLLVCFPLLSFGQSTDSLQVLREWEVDAERIFPDAFSNVYLLNASNDLRKLERDGRIRFEFQDVKLGNLAIVDVTDPLNLLLYYPEFQEIVLLDRTLSEVSRVSLTDFGFYAVEAVGYASDSRIWIYDPLIGTLKKIDAEGRVVIESQILPPLLGRMIQPTRILEINQLVYVICEEGSVLVFDAFGKYLEEIKWPVEMDFSRPDRFPTCQVGNLSGREPELNQVGFYACLV